MYVLNYAAFALGQRGGRHLAHTKRNLGANKKVRAKCFNANMSSVHIFTLFLV